MLFFALFAHKECLDDVLETVRLTQVPPVVWRHITRGGRSEIRLSPCMRLVG